MSFFSRMREKNKNKREGIVDNTVYFFEMTYTKDAKDYHVCFMAPNLQKAEIKAKLIKTELAKGSRLKSVKQLDQKNLAKSLTWNKKGVK